MRKGTRVYLENGYVAGIIVKSEKNRSLVEICKGTDLIDCKGMYFSDLPKEYIIEGTGKFAWIADKILIKSDIPTNFYVRVKGMSSEEKADILAILDDKGCYSRRFTSLWKRYALTPELEAIEYISVVRSQAYLSKSAVRGGGTEIKVEKIPNMKRTRTRHGGIIESIASYTTTLIWNPAAQKYDERIEPKKANTSQIKGKPIEKGLNLWMPPIEEIEGPNLINV